MATMPTFIIPADGFTVEQFSSESRGREVVLFGSENLTIVRAEGYGGHDSGDGLYAQFGGQEVYLEDLLPAARELMALMEQPAFREMIGELAVLD